MEVVIFDVLFSTSCGGEGTIEYKWWYFMFDLRRSFGGESTVE